LEADPEDLLSDSSGGSDSDPSGDELNVI